MCVPFKNFIQSPIALIPKDNGKDTRLIFHLSYLKDGQLVNSCTPKHMTSVKYPSFDDAVRRCSEEFQEFKEKHQLVLKEIYVRKSDWKSAFCNLGMLPWHFKYLIMKVKDPKDSKVYYFVDKCLPFGASISCAHFHNFSDSIAHMMTVKIGKRIINYLDDFLFVAYLRTLCNQQIQMFLTVFKDINFPVSEDKTVWAEDWVIFLGPLLNTKHGLVCTPKEKIDKALSLIDNVLNSKSKKATVHQIQQLCGYLYFLSRSILPRRAFNRRLYSITGSGTNKKIKNHHHVKIMQEAKLDLELWKYFLYHPAAYSQSFIDFSKT